MGKALLLLGADLGDPRAQVDAAERALDERGVHVLARSRDHWTAPWGFTSDRPFLNRALLVETGLAPLALLDMVLAVEQELGRVRRGGGYASRTIDIDILLIDDQVVEHPRLQVPHPLMHLRAFALAPAADVAPLHIHPVLGRPLLTLLDEVRRHAPTDPR